MSLSKQHIQVANLGGKIRNRYTLNGRSYISLENTPYTVIPGFIFQKQGPSSELILGPYMRMKLGNESRYTKVPKETAVSIGLFYRFGDAIIPKLSYEISHFTIGASYDITTSSLGGAGRFEISLQFINPNPFQAGRGNSSKFF